MDLPLASVEEQDAVLTRHLPDVFLEYCGGIPIGFGLQDGTGILPVRYGHGRLVTDPKPGPTLLVGAVGDELWHSGIGGAGHKMYMPRHDIVAGRHG